MEIDEDVYVEECRRRYGLDEEEILDKYKIFLAGDRTRMDREYDEANDNQTSLRGFKIRGTYSRLDDARNRAKYVRDNIEEAVHAFVVPVGTWFPVDMDADEVQDQDYMLPALNNLMGKYHEGTHARNAHYQERKREMEESAAQDNKSITKTRLQEKLRQKRNLKMRNERAEFERLTKSSDDKANAKKKKPKRQSNKKSETDEPL